MGRRSRKSSAEASVVPVAKEPPTAPTSAAEVEERVHLSFSVSADTFENLERAKIILSRKLPMGVTMEQTLEELLGFFLQHKARKARKRHTKESTSRHIPAAVRDEVFLRDGGRCTFTGPTGQRCGTRHDLELDHIRPFALGGKHDVENLRALCAAHNRFRARRTIGEAHVEREELPQRN